MDMLLDLTVLQSEQFLIPFLFILAVVFGTINVVNIFRNRGVNFLIALALAFFAASNTVFVQLLWSQFGTIAVFFIAMFFIIFILEAFGVRRGQQGKADGSDALVIYGAILFVLLSVGYLYLGNVSVPILGGGQNLLLFIFILFIIIIFWSAFKTTTPPRK